MGLVVKVINQISVMLKISEYQNKVGCGGIHGRVKVINKISLLVKKNQNIKMWWDVFCVVILEIKNFETKRPSLLPSAFTCIAITCV